MALLGKPEGVLCDISGVLKNSVNGKDVAIDGSIDAFHRLKDSQIPFMLCTNESLYTVEKIAEKLKEAGFEVSPDKIFSPISYMLKVIKEDNLRPYILAKQSIASVLGHHEVDADSVIVGDAEELFTYENMNKTFKQLVLGKKKFYCLGKSKYYLDEGSLKLDLGCFVTGLEYSSQQKASIAGKPSPEFFKQAAKIIGVDHRKAVMIGDDVESDVGGSMDAGLIGILVKTGKYRPQDSQHQHVKPSFIADNLSHAIDVILTSHN